LQALEMELKAKEKEEAEAVASHTANHDSILSEEKKKKQKHNTEQTSQAIC